MKPCSNCGEQLKTLRVIYQDEVSKDILARCPSDRCSWNDCTIHLVMKSAALPSFVTPVTEVTLGIPAVIDELGIPAVVTDGLGIPAGGF